MRRFICITGLTSLLIGMLACADRDKDNVIPDKEQAEVTLTYTSTRAAGSIPAPKVFVFRNQEGNYLYVQMIADGWTADGTTSGGAEKWKRSVQLQQGDYKFLYAAGFGTNTHLSPETLSGDTGFDDISFVNIPLADGSIPPSDELYLQFPAEETGKEYSIISPITVSATLRRAVSQVVLHLKRGHLSNGVYVPEPYTDDSDNITQHLESIDITLEGVAQSVSLSGSSGEGSTSASYDVSGATPDADGFVSLPGFFFIPRTGQPLKQASFTFHLQPGSLLENVTRKVDLSTYPVVQPNQQLEITLWFNSFDAPINIQVDVNTTFAKQDGDQGTWN